MSWLSSIFIAVITAILSAFIGSFIAERAAVWYRISSFEGGSGYFTIFVGLGAMIAGLALGLIVARVVSAGASPGFAKALWLSCLIAVAIGGAAALTSRSLADVPPEIAGEKLMLMVEVKWPNSQSISPASDPIQRRIDLGMLSGSRVRTSKQGPLWSGDARLEDGHWIAPAAVELFSSRGKRVISVEPAIANANGLVLPMPSAPTEANFVWSDWLTREQEIGSSRSNDFSYRFKVAPRSQASHTENIGPFEIGTVASEYYVGNIIDGQTVMTGKATFNVRVGEQQLFTGASSVAMLPGTPPALLVEGRAPNGQSGCHLVEDRGHHAEIIKIADCASLTRAEPFTNDDGWRKAARSLPVVQGRVDRVTYMHEGEYLFTDAIFDTGIRAKRPSGPTDYKMGFNRSIAPFGISPSRHHYARLGHSENQQANPALLIFSTDSLPPYLVPIDRERTRYPGDAGVTSDWMLHYFEWKRSPGGLETLEPRTNAVPLPNHGVTSAESDGTMVYAVYGTDARMVRVLGDFLVSDFHSTRLSDGAAPDHFRGHVGDIEVTVFANATSHSASLYIKRNSGTNLVQRISTSFNEVLATGRYDSLFSY